MISPLPGDYIAGFVDGEGCFALNFRRDVRRERKGTPVYFYWDVEFAIFLRADDRPILEKIQQTLLCGRIGNPTKTGAVRFSVYHMDDLVEKVIPFFERYPLRAKKFHDFELWKEAVHLLYKNRGAKTNISSTGNARGSRNRLWNQKDLVRLKKIQLAMRQYKNAGREWKWLYKT